MNFEGAFHSKVLLSLDENQNFPYKLSELFTSEVILFLFSGETSHNMNPELTPEQIADAILAVNAITTA